MFLVLLLCLLLFFRDALLARLTLLYGDSYDGMIEVAILNHWYNVAAHGAAWNATGWFAPYGDTIGYNDSYIIPGLFFTIARFGGADPFLAAFASHVAMKAIGFLGMYALLRRGVLLGTGLALAGAALFATANASLLHMYHGQLLAVGLTPWLMLLAIGAVRGAIDDRPRTLWSHGVAFALLFGLTALNSYYQIWFLCMFALVFVPVGLAVAGPVERSTLLAATRRHWRALAVLLAIWAAGLVPFLMVYLPKLAESGGHAFARDVRNYLPILSTYGNIGTGNLLWGHILPIGGLRQGEHRFGFAPIMILLLLVAAVEAFRHRRRARIAWALALTLAILMLLMTRWSHAFSLWKFVYELVPGASGVRVITRFLLFLLIPAIALVMLGLARWRHRPIAVTLIVALLLLEQVQLAAPLMLDRNAQMRMLAAVGPPPPGCDTFFVVSARLATEPLQDEANRILAVWNATDAPGLMRRYRHNVDAMMLASYYRRATINGFSTFNPPDWDFERPDDPSYISRVRHYVAAHPVGRLCGLDRRRNPRWFRMP